MIVLSDFRSCTGCLICEMVCSFHHTGAFSRSGSSITVRKSIFSDRETTVRIRYEKQADGVACDLCDGEESALCITHCPENALQWEG